MTKRRLWIILLCGGGLILFALAVLLRPSPALYRVTVLPSLGGQFTLPYAINDRGQVAGLSEIGLGNYHLLLWDRARGIQDLGPVCKNVVDINNAGQIVGTMADPNGRWQAFLWDPDSGRQLLGMLGGLRSEAKAINDLGQVVGTVEMSAGVSHIFIWDSVNGMRDLGPGQPSQINDAGQILTANLAFRDLLLSANEGSTGIKMPVSAVMGLRSINNHGCVVGYRSVAGARPELAMWHSGSGVVKPMHMCGEARAYVINDANQVLFAREQLPLGKVLGLTLRPYRVKCYLHDPAHGVIPLNRYVRTESNEHLYPVDLNNKGDIVCAIGRNRSRATCVVLLEPIPKWWGE